MSGGRRPRGGATDPGSKKGEVEGTVVTAARAGDERAFTRIIEHYDPRLRMLAFQVLRDRDAMDDALQDAYVSAYKALPDFRGEAAMGTWLYRLTYNACLAHLRRRTPLPLPDEQLEQVCPAPDPAGVAEARGDLTAALAALSPDQRAAVVLVMWDGLDYRSAAEVLGIPVGTLSSRLTAARTRLRALLDGGPEEAASHA